MFQSQPVFPSNAWDRLFWRRLFPGSSTVPGRSPSPVWGPEPRMQDLFADAGDAAMFYYYVYPDMRRQHTLCLPRALFIATTSKRFKKHGTLFIGTFLPTVRMHAWVMEDGMQADRYDNQWIYYRPVQMML